MVTYDNGALPGLWSVVTPSAAPSPTKLVMLTYLPPHSRSPPLPFFCFFAAFFSSGFCFGGFSLSSGWFFLSARWFFFRFHFFTKAHCVFLFFFEDGALPHHWAVKARWLNRMNTSWKRWSKDSHGRPSAEKSAAENTRSALA